MYKLTGNGIWLYYELQFKAQKLKSKDLNNHKNT